MTETSPYLSYNETIRLLAEFLEVAFHNILYLRQVYPPDLFDKFKKYDVPVFRSRHPALVSYIADVVSQTTEELAKGTVAKVVLAIQDNSTAPPDPLEHFVFDIQYMVDLLEVASKPDERPTKGHGTHAEVQLRLRAFLMKLSVCEAQLVDLPEDLTWTTFLELTDPTATPSSEGALKADLGPQWTPADGTTFRDFPTSISERPPPKAKMPQSRILPLKSEGLGMIHMQLMVEEHPRKIDLLDKKEKKVADEARRAAKGKGRA